MPKEKLRPDAAAQDRQSGRQVLLECALSLLLLFSICFLPALHVFASNASGVSLAEQMPTVWLYFGISALLFAALRLICRRRPYFAGMLSAVVAFFLVNFSFLQFPFEQFLSNYVLIVILSLVLFALLIVGAVFLFLRLTKKRSVGRGVVLIFCITFCALLALNTVTLAVNRAEAKRAAAARKQQAAEATATAILIEEPTVEAAEATATPEAEASPTPSLFTAGDTPNIYFFIADEYAASAPLMQYYGYDNSAFESYLEDLGFNLSKTSYALAADTLPNIVNLLSLDYISLTKNAKQVNRRECVLFTELRGLGYDLYQSSTSASVLGSLPNMRNVEQYSTYKSTTRDGVESDQLVQSNSLFGALEELLGSYRSAEALDSDSESLQKYGYYSMDEIVSSDAYFDNAYYAAQVRLVLEAYGFFENKDNYFETDKPVAMFSYIKCPHAPFVFDEYGRVQPQSQATNWRDPSLYVGQFKFATKHLSTIVTEILAFDPNCIIVIQSDHGIRKHKQLFDEPISSKAERHVFNAVYFCGMELDIEGLSPINTLRLIMTQLGKEYPLIEDYVTADSSDDLSDVPEAFSYSAR